MDVVVERCAGLDVHRDDVVATVRVPGTGRRRWEQQTRTFRATLAGLSALGEWLAEAGVTLVGMEATGVYWKTVFQALEDRFECWLLNAHHLRNVPGRKTDVKDSEWICQLVQHGLVRPSFVPPPEIRRLRDLTRLRKAQINERARSIQRLEKVLQDAGIKLTSVASHTYSKSARAMLEALLSGVADPEQLAELAKSRMRVKIPQLREALAALRSSITESWSPSCSRKFQAGSVLRPQQHNGDSLRQRRSPARRQGRLRILKAIFISWKPQPRGADRRSVRDGVGLHRRFDSKRSDSPQVDHASAMRVYLTAHT